MLRPKSSFSAWAGVTSSVTALTTLGLVSSRPASWAIASTTICSSTILETGAAASSLVLSTTSTRLPGRAKPATPTTSFTFTVMARLPWAITADKPPLEPGTASLDSTIGTPRCTLVLITRVSSIFGSAKAPPSAALCGQSTTSRCSIASRVPIGKSLLATTTLTLADAARADIQRAAISTAASPSTADNTSIATDRLFIAARLPGQICFGLLRVTSDCLGLLHGLARTVLPSAHV